MPISEQLYGLSSVIIPALLTTVILWFSSWFPKNQWRGR